MTSLGPGELTLVLVALVLVFSSGRLGSMGDALGRRLRGKRDAPASAPEKPASPTAQK